MKGKVFLKEFINKIKEKLRSEKIELLNTKWMTEIIKDFIIVCVTAVVLFALRNNSPGNKSGEDLQLFLTDEVERILETNNSDKNVELDVYYAGEYERITESKVLLTYGRYIPKGKNEKSGRFIALFERKEANIINDIIGSMPKYEITFASYIDYSEDEYLLYCVEVDDVDLDGDGKKELLLALRSNHADSIRDCLIMLTNHEDKWKIMTINSGELKSCILPAEEENNTSIYMPGEYKGTEDASNVFLNIDIYSFTDGFDKTIKYDVYGVTRNCSVNFLRNPLSNKGEVCYEFDYDYYINNNHERDGILYVMGQLYRGDILIEPNWNNGVALLEDYDFDFADEAEVFWGYQPSDGMIFYKEPSAGW